VRIVSLSIERYGTLAGLDLSLGAPAACLVSAPVEASPRAGRAKSARKTAAAKTARASAPLFEPETSAAATATTGSGITVIHGPNEAGKSTLLRAIRFLLLGDEKTAAGKRAAALAGGEGPSVRAVVELGSGSQIEIQRRKSKPGWTGRLLPSGDEVGEDWFMGALGHPDASLFRNVFAFSLDELARGRDTLEKGHLGGLLFGSGLGGMIQPSTLLEGLEEERARFFKERGQQQSVPLKLARIDGLKAELRGSTTTSEELERLDRAIEAKVQSAADARAALQSLEQERARLAALASALEPFAEWRAAKNELATLTAAGPVTPLPASARLDMERARTARAQAAEEIDREEAARPAIERELQTLVFDRRLLDAAADIDALDRARSAYVEAARELLSRAADREALLRKIERRLEELAPNLGLVRLRELSIPKEMSARLSAAAAELQRLDREAREAGAIAKASRAERDALERERAALPPAADTTKLRAWLHEATENLALRERLDSLDADVVRLKRSEAILLAKLDPPPPGNDPALAPLPRSEEIDAFDRYLAEHEDKLRHADREIARSEEALAAIRRDLAELTATGSVPTEGDLVAARDRRALGWQLVRQALESQSEGHSEEDFAAFVEGRSLPDAFENAILDADDVADRLRLHADAVTRRAQKEAAEAQLEDELVRLVEARNAAIAEESSARAAWIDLWRPSNLVPRGPAVMRSWLSDRERWLTTSEQLRDAQNARMTLAEKLDTCVTRGRSLLRVDGELVALRAEAERRTNRERDRESAEARIASAHARAEEQIARAETATGEREAEREAAEAEFARVWAALDLGVSVAANVALQLLDDLVRLRDGWLETEDEHERRERNLEANQKAFVSRLDGVLAKLGRAREAASVDADVAMLRERLDEARNASRRERELSERLARIQADCDRRRALVERSEAALRSLYEAAAVTNDIALEEVIERAEHAAKLGHVIAESERALARARGAYTLDALLEAAAGASSDALASDLRALEGRRQAESTTLEQHLEELARLRAERARLDGSGRAAALLSDLAGERAALRNDVERYAVLTLAKAVLEQSIEEFERANQPALVEEASRLFAEMTGGRYARVRATAKREIFVERADGERRSPEELSTGTNEQLFFALRLAYVTLYGTRAEPLPVVLDDILVNFDRQRTAATLAALGTFGARTQVLLFTCHPHIVDLAREALPGARILGL
jgi:uncharacterized protein YhaN